jgi:hypothetical protein
MSILEMMEFNCVEYQIKYGIKMRCNFIFFNATKLKFGIVGSNSTQYREVGLCFGRGVSSYSQILENWALIPNLNSMCNQTKS